MLLSITNRVQACLGHLKYCRLFSMLWRGTVVCYLKKISPLYSASISGSALEPATDYCSWLLFIKFIAGLLFFFCKECYFPPPISSRLFYFLGSSGAIYMPFGSCKKFCSQLSNWMEVMCSPARTDGVAWLSHFNSAAYQGFAILFRAIANIMNSYRIFL